MTRLKLDFSEIPGNDIADGVYEAIVDKVVVKESKRSEFNNLNWTFEITEGEHVGRKVFTTTPTSPAGLWRTRDFFKKFSHPDHPEAIADIEYDEASGDILTPDFVGLSCLIKVVNTEYEGVVRPGVKAIIRVYSTLEKDPNVDEEEDLDDEEEDLDDDSEDHATDHAVMTQ